MHEGIQLTFDCNHLQSIAIIQYMSSDTLLFATVTISKIFPLNSPRDSPRNTPVTAVVSL